MMLPRRLRIVWPAALALAAGLAAQTLAPAPAAVPAVCVVAPFANRSGDPSLDWIGESFRIAFTEALRGAPVAILDRQEWTRALQLGGVPPGERVSHATLMRIADSADARWLVVGWFDYDGENFRASASLVDLQREHMIAIAPVAGPLAAIESLQAQLGWALREQLNPGATPAPAPAAQTPLPLPAYESYVRALLAGSDSERLSELEIASHLAPNDPRIALLLGQTWLDAGDTPADNANALRWLAAVTPAAANFLQAQFWAGIAAYRAGDYGRAVAFFSQVKDSLPLPAVTADLALAQAGATAAGAGAVVVPQPPSAASVARLQTDFPADDFRQLEGVVAQFDAAKAKAMPLEQQIGFELREGGRLTSEGGYDAALRAFQAALALLGPAPALPSPQAAEAHLGLARIWMLRHQNAQAEAEVRAALAADPGNAQAQALARQLAAAKGGSGA